MMKRFSTNFSVLALMCAICVGFAACNEPQKESGQNKKGVEAHPIPVSEIGVEIFAFFEENLPTISGSRSETFFVNDGGDKCLIINNAQELEMLVHSSVELPVIDFDNYTLIVGQQMVPTTGFKVLNQSLNIGSESLSLTLNVEAPQWAYQAFTNLYYWGIYSKLPELPIDVSIIE